MIGWAITFLVVALVANFREFDNDLQQKAGVALQAVGGHGRAPKRP